MTPDEFDFILDQLITMRGLTINDEARGHWWDAFRSVEAPVFREAVRRMIEDDDSYPSPARVRKMCAAVVNERLSRVVQPTPPAGLSQEEYSRWEQEWRRQIVRGASADQAQHAALEAKAGNLQITQTGGQGAVQGLIMDW